MVFPVSIGEFRRIEIARYKPDGTDESAGYNYAKPMNEIVATVYVFPSLKVTDLGSPAGTVKQARDMSCQRQFQTVEEEVKRAYPNAIPIEESAVTLVQADASYSGYKASYDLPNMRAYGRPDVTSRSEAYVFCYAGGKWTVEYRIDHPSAFDAGPLIADFMRDLTWTIPRE